MTTQQSLTYAEALSLSPGTEVWAIVPREGKWRANEKFTVRSGVASDYTVRVAQERNGAVERVRFEQLSLMPAQGTVIQMPEPRNVITEGDYVRVTEDHDSMKAGWVFEVVAEERRRGESGATTYGTLVQGDLDGRKPDFRWSMRTRLIEKIDKAGIIKPGEVVWVQTPHLDVVAGDAILVTAVRGSVVEGAHLNTAVPGQPPATKQAMVSNVEKFDARELHAERTMLRIKVKEQQEVIDKVAEAGFDTFDSDEWEDFADNYGLPLPERDYQVEVAVTVRRSIPARGQEDADDKVADAVKALFATDYRVISLDPV